MTAEAADPVLAALLAERERRRIEADPEVQRLQRARTAYIERWAPFPLATFQLWQPECRRCPRPEKGQPWRGQTMAYMGPGNLHKCPSCGIVEERTSQRRAGQLVLSVGVEYALVMGGNRSGKTELGAAMDAVFMLGASHPAVQHFAQRNGLTLTRVQRAPGRVWMSHLTWPDALEYGRPKVDGLVPRDVTRRHWTLNQQAEVVWGEGRGTGRVVSKVCAQGREAYQGSAIHLGHFDEEPPLDVFEECLMRCVDYRAPLLFTMTSLEGWTPLLKRLLAHRITGEQPPAGVVDYELHSEDNPHIDASFVVRAANRTLRAGSRLRGEIVDLTGRVHAAFSRGIHLIDPFPLPADWTRAAAIDFGYIDPFVHIWGAVGPDRTVIIYRLRYASERLLRDHAEAIHEVETCQHCRPLNERGEPCPVISEEWQSWRIDGSRGLALLDGQICPHCQGTGYQEPPPFARWHDPSGAASAAELVQQHSLAMVPANNDRLAGMDLIHELLALDGAGKPHLQIFRGEDTAPLVAELEGLKHGKVTPTQKAPTIGADHAWDALRYLLMGLRASRLI